MKKLIVMILALTAVLVLACGAASAECALKAYLDRISDPADPVSFVIATTEYEEMTPPEGYAPNLLIEVFNQGTIEPADLSETPEGEYVVLRFPDDNIRFDFFMADDAPYFRQVNADGSEELFKVTMSDEAPVNFNMAMEADADLLASSLGLIPDVVANMPGEGWVVDGVNGAVWQDDRASLEIFLEDVDNFKVFIMWGSSAWETTEWVYACDYDDAAKKLNARYVICDNVVYDEDNNETRTNVYEKESAAVFSLTGDGKVLIENAGDDALEGKTFTQMLEEGVGDDIEGESAGE